MQNAALHFTSRVGPRNSCATLRGIGAGEPWEQRVNRRHRIAEYRFSQKESDGDFWYQPTE